MQEQKFIFLEDRPEYYDLMIILAFLATFIVGSSKLSSMHWWIAVGVLSVISIIYASGRRVKITLTDEGLVYQSKKNQFSSVWADLQFIEMANYPSTITRVNMSHGPNAFRIITKLGTSDWIRPFIINTDSRNKIGDPSNKIGDNITYLFDIIKQKSGISPGLGSSFYNRKIN